MKTIRLSLHAIKRVLQRGTTREEVVECIRQSSAIPAGSGRTAARKTFLFESLSPINSRFYKFKTVEAIFIEEAAEIVVVTVKVYYSNKETSL